MVLLATFLLPSLTWAVEGEGSPAPPPPAVVSTPPLPSSSPVSPPLRPFPDPVLLKKSKTLRTAGAVLTLTGIAATFGAINLVIYNARSPDAMDPTGYAVLRNFLLLYGTTGVFIGGPTWSVGAEMRIQLNRMNVGDELLRQPVANDPAYWQARTLSHFGSGVAVSGGAQLVLGGLTLGLLGATIGSGVFDSEDGQQRLADAGISDARVLLLLPIGQMALGGGILAGGLSMWSKGKKRAARIRQAAEVQVLLPLPSVDLATGTFSLNWSGSF